MALLRLTPDYVALARRELTPNARAVYDLLLAAPREQLTLDLARYEIELLELEAWQLVRQRETRPHRHYRHRRRLLVTARKPPRAKGERVCLSTFSTPPLPRRERPRPKPKPDEAINPHVPTAAAQAWRDKRARAAARAAERAREREEARVEAESIRWLYDNEPPLDPKCDHQWEEIDCEPPFDVCIKCGGVVK